MNGWNVASSPSSTPMPRVRDLRAHRASPRRSRARSRSRIRCHCSVAPIALQQRDRAAGGRGSRAIVLEQIELGVEALRRRDHVEVADRLEHAVAEPVERRARAPRARARSASAAGVAAPSRVRWLSLRPVENPTRAGLERVAHERAASPRCRRRSRPRRRPRARPSRTCAARRAAPAHATSIACGVAVERVHVLGERLPAPRDALGERGAGDVLDALHQLDQRARDPRRGTARSRRRSCPSTTVVTPCSDRRREHRRPSVAWPS